MKRQLILLLGANSAVIALPNGHDEGKSAAVLQRSCFDNQPGSFTILGCTFRIESLLGFYFEDASLQEDVNEEYLARLRDQREDWR